MAPHPRAADGERTRTWVPDWPCSPAQVLRPQRRGARDPTPREDDAGRTWRSVGGSGLPTSASAGEQTYRAKLLYKQRGRSPWPTCGRLL